jgi:hypothetical protein
LLNNAKIQQFSKPSWSLLNEGRHFSFDIFYLLGRYHMAQITVLDVTITELVYNHQHVITHAINISCGKSDLMRSLNSQVVFCFSLVHMVNYSLSLEKWHIAIGIFCSREGGLKFS